MEFLKAFFGDKAITYDELIQAINVYNGDEKNKEKLIKMVNLTDGGYVSKDKYTNLETDLSGKTTELTKANNLIEELKKSAGKDEETQQKITAYETEIADLKKENAELKTENALKFALVAAGAVDVDYLVFKAKEKGEIKLGDDGKIKGEDDLISGLKTQHPTMFEASNGNQQRSGDRKILENNLPGGDKDKEDTRVDAVLPFVTNAQIGDATNEDFLGSLGVGNFDVCIVAIGDNFQNSLEVTSLLKELGAKMVVSRAARDVHAKFLLRNGADEIVYPERQLADWVAIRYSADHIFDYIELDEEHAIFEISIPGEWIGKTIGQLDIRKKYDINIMALKTNDIMNLKISSDTQLLKDSTMLVLGETKHIQKCFHI